MDLAPVPLTRSFLGSGSAAPLKKVSLTCSLKAPTEHTRPFCDHTGVPHFHSSVRSGAAARIRPRSFASRSPLQSCMSEMYLVMVLDAALIGILAPSSVVSQAHAG